MEVNLLSWAWRQWKRALTGIIVFNFLLIVIVTIYQHSVNTTVLTKYYQQLVFVDRLDQGETYRGFMSRYYDVDACPQLPASVPTYSIMPNHGNVSQNTKLISSSNDSSHNTMKLPNRDASNREALPSTGNLFLHSIGLALAITTRRLDDQTNITEDNLSQALPFFRSLLPSFCRTASPRYDYHFFLAYDFDDPYLTRKEFLDLFGRFMMAQVARSCPIQSGYTLHYIRCPYKQKVTWAQNDAAIEAYMNGIEYIYRINDDTDMETSGWTETFISVLRHLDPPNVGICGPKHNRGNLKILTYEFTHRSHIEIFGCYYPRILKNWDGDVWMTNVYRPERSFQIQHITLLHTLDAGTRYQVTSLGSWVLRNIIQENKAALERYIAAKREKIKADPGKVIAMAVNMTDPRHLWGVVRNAQLRSVYFSDWTLRVYITCDAVGRHISGSNQENYGILQARVLRTLKSLGADIYQVDREVSQQLPVAVWSYLAVDDPNVDYVLISNPEFRLSNKEFKLVSKWIRKPTRYSDNLSDRLRKQIYNNWLAGGRTKGSICIIGQSKPINSSVVLTSWAAKTEQLKLRLGTSMKISLMNYKKRHQIKFEHQFFNRVIWPSVYDLTACCVSTINRREKKPLLLRNKILCPRSTLQVYDEHEVSESDQSLKNEKHSLFYFLDSRFWN